MLIFSVYRVIVKLDYVFIFDGNIKWFGELSYLKYNLNIYLSFLVLVWVIYFNGLENDGFIYNFV